jgi:hypothetical protein
MAVVECLLRMHKALGSIPILQMQKLRLQKKPERSVESTQPGKQDLTPAGIGLRLVCTLILTRWGRQVSLLCKSRPKVSY